MPDRLVTQECEKDLLYQMRVIHRKQTLFPVLPLMRLIDPVVWYLLLCSFLHLVVNWPIAQYCGLENRRNRLVDRRGDRNKNGGVGFVVLQKKNGTMGHSRIFLAA